MSAESRLFRINTQTRESEKIAEVDFADIGLQERWDIQEWIAANPDILGDDLLIISKEFSGFDRTNERLDLLAVDTDGKLVIIELKRDDSGSEVHWQAIKYASYLRQATQDEIIHMLAAHEKVSGEEAERKLMQHIEPEDIEILNNDQRIILASHRFAPEVTSAVLWVNDQSRSEDMITCVRLTPYQDENSDTLYLQASTIIPLPDAEEFIIQIGVQDNESSGESSASLRKISTRKITPDEFATKVGRRNARQLIDAYSPDMTKAEVVEKSELRKGQVEYLSRKMGLTFRPARSERR